MTDAYTYGLGQELMDGFIGIRVGADHRRDRSDNHDGGGNGAVFRDDLVCVAALDTLALSLVEQVLACCHGGSHLVGRYPASPRATG